MFYQRLEKIESKVRSNPRLNSALTKGLVIENGWIKPLRMYPLFAIKNPVIATAFEHTYRYHLSYPVDGKKPEKKPGVEFPNSWTDPGPITYSVPEWLFFTLNSAGRLVSVDRTPLGVVVFWQGIEQPGVKKARLYPMYETGEQDLKNPLSDIIRRGRYGILLGGDPGIDEPLHSAWPRLGLDVPNTREISSALAHINLRW
jgi:hypothetical protein